ncbi:hypothetical protein B0T21DRAFT_363276 [Apiosordaria backusii]|uniref:Uncharacterized protein n=1 Tax=Apiosordaria backusii TaxID=314023 RepID=A0AA40BSW0_9PEZI|nr:hypothetical protein B0T21DRAFT_363276 [Apiosordaria backusii]
MIPCRPPPSRLSKSCRSHSRHNNPSKNLLQPTAEINKSPSLFVQNIQNGTPKSSNHHHFCHLLSS